MIEIPVGVLIISRELAQAYAVDNDSGDLLSMAMLKDAAVAKDTERYTAIERAIRIGMGMGMDRSNLEDRVVEAAIAYRALFKSAEGKSMSEWLATGNSEAAEDVRLAFNRSADDLILRRKS